MPRDRRLTMTRLLAAAESIIAREGVAAAGVNAIAQAAGVDKVLLYRYFGGVAPLLRTLVRERRLWPDLALPSSAPDERPSLAGDLTLLLLEDARAVRDAPFARRMLAWHLAARDDLARELSSARDTHLRAIADALHARHRIPPYLDLAALIALLWGSAMHLALASGAPAAGGLDLRRDADWARAERALVRTIVALVGDGE